MRRIAAAAVTLVTLLSGCSLLPGAGGSASTPDGGGPMTSAPAPASDDLKAMTAAYDAFTKELGPTAAVLGVSYRAATSIAYTGLTTQSLVYSNGTLTKTWDRMPGAAGDKAVPLSMFTPERLMTSLSAKGACPKATQVGAHVYWGGWRLIDGMCGDRVVQVTSAGDELKPVDMTTKEGFNQLWADLLSYGPGTLPIHRYEYLFTADGTRQPGVYIKSGTLVQYRLANPVKTPAFNEVIEKADPPGPSTTFVISNGTAFWNAYQAAKTKCGTVDKVAVAWQGTTQVIVGSNTTCSATTDANGKAI